MKNRIKCNAYSNDEDHKECYKCKGFLLIVDPKEENCNLCGNNLHPEDSEFEPYGLVNTAVTGGYFSTHLSDMSKYTFSLCESCLRDLFVKCKIKPEIEDMLSSMDSYAVIFDADQEQHENRMYERSEKPQLKYNAGICNVNRNCFNKAVYSLFSNNKFTTKCSCEEHYDVYWERYYEKRSFISKSMLPFI